MKCACGNNCQCKRISYSMWKYVVLIVVLYCVTYSMLVNKILTTNDIVTVCAIVLVLLFVFDNTDYFYEKQKSKNLVYYPAYQHIPNLNTSPSYNKNNTFQMHDGGMNYYYGFYPANATPPSTGNDLQNFYLTPLDQNANAYIDMNDTIQKLESYGVTDKQNYMNVVNDCSTCKIPGTYQS